MSSYIWFKKRSVHWFYEKAINNEELWKEDKNGNFWMNIDILESKMELYAKINKVCLKDEPPFNGIINFTINRVIGAVFIAVMIYAFRSLSKKWA